MRRQAVPLAHRRLKTSGTLSPAEWAQIIVEEAAQLGFRLTPRQVAEGVGVVQAESSGNADNLVQGPSGHIGAWSEEPGFGSTEERLDPRVSTRAALKRWKADGESWWPAWGRWEQEQSGASGTNRYKQYLAIAKHALAGSAAPRSRPTGQSKQPPAGESALGGIAGDLMHLGLTAALVVGGAALVGLGATRMLGTAGRSSQA